MLRPTFRASLDLSLDSVDQLSDSVLSSIFCALKGVIECHRKLSYVSVQVSSSSVHLCCAATTVRNSNLDELMNLVEHTAFASFLYSSASTL